MVISGLLVIVMLWSYKPNMLVLKDHLAPRKENDLFNQYRLSRSYISMIYCGSYLVDKFWYEI